ncbi:MAG: endonuclease/exonuclease/phosphatase family protein [Pseudohongiellaceae bacterium]
MAGIFSAIVVVLLLLTLTPRLQLQHWTVRVLDYPRLQLFTISLVLLVLELLLLDFSNQSSWWIVAATLFCLGYQGWWIYPYTPLVRVEVKNADALGKDRTVKLLVANVYGKNRRAEPLLALVEESKPDLLLTLESNSWWEKQLDSLEPEYPYTIKRAQENLYGMHLYSKLPLSQSSIEYLLNDDIPSIHTLVSLPCGEKVRAHFLHPDPPHPKFSVDTSERDAELVIVGRSVADDDSPTLVAGDLNDVAWSSTTRLFRKISRLRDPRVGRGMFNTYSAEHWFLRWPLDHLFVSDHFTVNAIRKLGNIRSDHFPLFTELVCNGNNLNPDNKPALNQEDRTRASQKLADEGVDRHDVPNPRAR